MPTASSTFFTVCSGTSSRLHEEPIKMSVDVFSSHMNAERARLDPARAAVIVVDMINEFCKPGGKMVLPGYEVLVRAAARGDRCGAESRRAGRLGP